MAPNTLVIFDYSGTLSLSAVEFGRPGNLRRQLEQSGLAGLGLDTPDRYWQALVAPTWTIASSSGKGFKSIAADRIRTLAGPAADRTAITSAINTFVDAYMHHSSIETSWQPLLADLQKAPDALALVATDHYAEATPAILGHLGALGIDAASAVLPEAANPRTTFKVANSADIGCSKADRHFWLTLRKTCLATPFKNVILIDDFGANEQDQSGYADDTRIAPRIAATRRALADVFATVPQIVHFSAEANIHHAVASAAEVVRKALAA